MDNVPVRVSNVAPAGRETRESASPDGQKHSKQKKNTVKRGTKIIIAAILVVALALAGWFAYRASTATSIDSSKYQAVFFTSGQVYFGKLQTTSNGYFKLTNVFYIQAQDSNNAKDSANPQQAGSDKPEDLQLIKLGSEVHGPDDEMIISKDQVLFFENLKKEGKVSQSIDKFNSTEKK
jgi:hypothetical protein